MDEHSWSDARVRAFVVAVRASDWRTPVDETDRDAFVRSAMVRIVPTVAARMLADVGAVIDPVGTARVAYEVLEREAWSRRGAWLMVTPRPWELLAERTTKVIRTAYRASESPKADRRAVARIPGGTEA